jgi:hypothetical protein
MQLPNLFGRKTAADHFFLSLFLADGVLQAGLWAVQNNQILLLEHSGPRHYDLPEAAISLVDEAFQELGPDSEKATKVVFGFEPSWIDKTGVHAQRKAFLKKLTTELNLEPVGFVSLTESVIQQLFVQDSLFSAVVMLFHGAHVFGFLCKQGKVLAQVDIGRAEDVILDARELLSRLGKQAKAADHYLPPQILLGSTAADDVDLAVHQHHLMNHQWTPEYPFVQSPTIDLLPPNFVLEAITSQGGLAVAKAHGLITAASQLAARPLEGNSAGTGMFPPVTDSNGETPTDEEITTEAEEAATADSIPPQATSFGVPVSTDHLTSSGEDLHADLVEPEIDDFAEPAAVAAAPIPPGSFVAFPHSHHPVVIKKVVILSALAGLITVVLAGWLAMSLFYKTLVTVQLATGTVAKDVKITLDPKVAASDPENLILKADLIKKDVTGSDTIATTGVKLVGDKATGTAVLLNKTTSVKALAKGTELTAGKIKFVLQDDVQLASASAASSGLSLEFSQTQAKIIAADIGADSNLPKDTALKIASFDPNTYSGTIKETLTGGSSREVRVVSIEDRQKLQKSLTDDLTKEAAADFKQDSTDGRFIMPTGRILQSTPKFDAEVGKETDVLGLSLTDQFEGLAYTRTDLQPLVNKILGGEVPSGYQLAQTDPQILSSAETVPGTSGAGASGSAKIVLSANVSAQTEPLLTADELRQQLLGLAVPAAETKLKNLATLKQSQIQFNPSLARWLIGKLPSKPDRIEVTIQRP